METGEQIKPNVEYPRYSLLAYMVFLVALITLIPFQFQLPGNLAFTWYFYPSGIFTNILLFMPVGFLLRSAKRKEGDKGCLRELLFGLLMSLAFEILQGFMPNRVPSGYDLLSNGMGAWLGAQLLNFFKRKIDRKQTVRLFETELPLMIQVYLLIPLIWLNGMSVGNEKWRMLLPALLIVIGSYLLLAVYYYGLKPKGTVTPIKFTLLVLGWCFVSASAAMLQFPGHVIVFLAAMGIFIRIRTRELAKTPFPVIEKGKTRRYELPTLKRLLPVYGIYLLILFLWPTTLALPELQSNYIVNAASRPVYILRFVERIAAFTLLGYMIAEMRGRKKESSKNTLGLLVFIPLFYSSIEKLVKWTDPFAFLTLLELLMMISAAIYGAFIYRLQLKVIRGTRETDKCH